MSVREHLIDAESIDVVVNGTPHSVKTLEFSSGATVDTEDSTKLNIEAGGGQDFVYRDSGNDFVENIDVNTTVANPRGTLMNDGFDVRFGDISNPNIITLQGGNGTGVGTGSWSQEDTYLTSDIFGDNSNEATYIFNNTLSDIDGLYPLTASGTVAYQAGVFLDPGAIDMLNVSYLANTSLIGSINSMSMSFWVYVTSTADQTFVSWNRAEFGIYSGKFVLVPKSTGRYYSIPEINTWYHIVVNCRSTTDFDVYINQILETPTSTVGYATGGDGSLYIGQRTYNGSFLFSGLLSQLRLFNRPLTENEVNELSLIKSGDITITHNLNQLQSEVYINYAKTINTEYPVFSDNSDAINNGLIAGDIYADNNGNLKIVN